ncbi:hypothetical protein CBS14141_004375 [Malassezia furfur]|nr:hypothetical protein CBS14141_004375 [Malassezia furfur]
MYRSRRNKSQPTLRIADDHEFLQALEQVRSQHQERMAQRAQRAQARTARKASMPNLRQSSPARRTVRAVPAAAEEADEPDTSHASGYLDAETTLSDSDAALSDSAASDASHVADDAAGGGEAPGAADAAADGASDGASDDEASIDESIANELGIGHATGNAPGKPFTNDADWKKEVKALFLIRELVQTERSYARHLESLLIVVLKWAGTTSTSTRMQTNVLMPSQQQQPAPASVRLPSNAPPPHLLTLRKMLPQLISISRALVYRIEESPSSVGVAHAFLVIRDQLEEVHVAWSGVVGATLRALRATEASKSKSKGRLGLVPLPDAALDVAADRRADKRKPPKELSPVDVAIMPTQRIPRYCLLLRDLLKNTSPDTPSYATLQTALQNVQELGRQCDLASSQTQ